MKIIPRRNSFLSLLDDDFFRDFYVSPFQGFSKSVVMKTDIIENEDSYVLEMDLPSVNKEDVKISLENGYLTVSVNKDHSEEEKDDKKKYIRRERVVENASRSFYVGDIKRSDIKAKYKDATLRITIPKEETIKETEKYIEIE
ncbi:TPA: Hsp20/alpha crystallin family protein [bacterium]|nr:Hsp20/alpha crystallin family protein [bacterium]